MAPTLPRFRALALAIVVSVAAHAAVVLGSGSWVEPFREAADVTFDARLVVPPAPPSVAPAAEAAPAPPARPRRKRPVPAIALAAYGPMAAVEADAVDVSRMGDPPRIATEPQAPPTPAPEVVALASPQAPPPVAAPDAFPVVGLPPSVSIEYQLTSAFADGRAEYRWDREGDHYRIQGEAHAEGFFTLFLEGSIVQESRGRVTPGGLRPDRFSEQRPDAVAEGLEFDWEGRRVTFERNGERRTSELEDNTVDWLSMIFQMAHVPPKAQDLDLRVFTQRKMYRFRLQVLGVEEVEIPLGRIAALHLRHEDPVKKEVVDVWLGIDQHFLPVKLRFPAARNRIVVDQVATKVVVR